MSSEAVGQSASSAKKKRHKHSDDSTPRTSKKRKLDDQGEHASAESSSKRRKRKGNVGDEPQRPDLSPENAKDVKKKQKKKEKHKDGDNGAVSDDGHPSPKGSERKKKKRKDKDSEKISGQQTERESESREDRADRRALVDDDQQKSINLDEPSAQASKKKERKKTKEKDRHKLGKHDSRGSSQQRKDSAEEVKTTRDSQTPEQDNHVEATSPKRKSKGHKHDRTEYPETETGIREHRQRKAVAIKTPHFDEHEAPPFFMQTSAFYLPLSPIIQSMPLEGLCAEHLSPLILTYYPPLKGIILAYENPRLSNSPRDPVLQQPEELFAVSINEYAVSYTWLVADFVLLKLERGTIIKGQVSIQHPNYLGLICWNHFNAKIDRERLPQGWTWNPATEPASNKELKEAPLDPDDMENDLDNFESTGHWEDANGTVLHGLIAFKVLDFECAPPFGQNRGFVSIEGALTEDDNGEKGGPSKVDSQTVEGSRKQKKGKSKRVRIKGADEQTS